MKKDLFNFFKKLEDLEIKDFKDFENLKVKCHKFKKKLNKKTESIENRLKIVILEKITEGLNQEEFIFKMSEKIKK